MTAETIPFPIDRTPPPITWRPPAGTRVISSDDHIQEPVGLFQDRVPDRFKDHAPRLFIDEDGLYRMTIGDEVRQSGAFLRKLKLDERPGCYDMAARLADMDAELIDQAMVYPQKSMPMLGMPDKDLVFACCDAYNEWLVEVARESGGRVNGIAYLPTLYRVEATRDYLQKVKDLGLKGVQLPMEPGGVQYNRSAMEPLWDAIEESGLPLSFHVRGFTTTGAGAFGSDLTFSFQPYRRLWATLAFSGILERHPTMKVVFAEGGISWVPAMLHDADRIFRIYADGMTPRLANPPSFYWHRQCHATFMEDPIGIRLMDEIGAGHALWSLDYPHPEGVFGSSLALMKGYFDTLGEEAARRVVGGNAAAIWNV